MTIVGNLLGLARASQALALTSENTKLLKKSLERKKSLKAKALTKNVLKNIVGINLIRVQAKVSSGL